jgi:hypothetical protein
MIIIDSLEPHSLNSSVLIFQIKLLLNVMLEIINLIVIKAIIIFNKYNKIGGFRR